jgi:hypothetical protein
MTFAILLIVLSVTGLVRSGLGSGPHNAACLVVTLAGAALWVYFLLPLYSVARRGCCIAFAPDGCFARSAEGTATVSWRDIRQVHCEKNSVIISLHPLPRMLTVNGIIRDRQDAATFMAAFAKARERYGTDAACAPPAN